MKNILFCILVVLAGIVTIDCGCNRVEPGFVGIRVNLAGGSKGVDQEVLGPGWWFTSWNSKIYEFPVFMQTIRWTEDPKDSLGGHPADEAVRFNDKNGMRLHADVGISYSLQPDKVIDIFKKQRKGIDWISDVYLHNIVQDAVNRVASTMEYSELNGPKKDIFLNKVLELVRADIGDEGFQIEHITILGSVKAPEEVQTALNNKMTAQQNAQAASAEAEANIARAHGESEANRLRLQSTNGALVEYQKVMNEKTAIEKWDGHLPGTMLPGQAMPFIGVK